MGIAILLSMKLEQTRAIRSRTAINIYTLVTTVAKGWELN
jgi:hypothetical protein